MNSANKLKVVSRYESQFSLAFVRAEGFVIGD